MSDVYINSKLFAELPAAQQEELVADLRRAAENGAEMVSPRGWIDSTTDEVFYSGLAVMTHGEYMNYLDCGGVWGYETPIEVAAELGVNI